MVRQKNQNRVNAGKNSVSKNQWIKEVFNTMKKNKISFKESMKNCSVERRSKNIEPVKVVRKKQKEKVKTEIKKPLKDE